MNVATGKQLIEHIESLPPLPAVVGRVLEVTGSTTSSVEDVARVLCEDQAYAAKILRVANSSFFGAGRRVTQVSRAVVLLGMVGVRNLVLGIAAREAFQANVEGTPHHATIWRHSIAVASASDAIAGHIGFKPAEEAFVAGLLLDIGQLAMISYAPDVFESVLNDPSGGGNLLELERENFGMDHTEAGFEILKRWGLPSTICGIVRQHHDESLNPDSLESPLLAIVVLADTMAQVMGFGFDLPVLNTRCVNEIAVPLGISDSEQLRVIDSLGNRIQEASDMLTEVDAASESQAEATAKRAVWVDANDAARTNLNQLLLEHCGYEVLRLSPAELGQRLSPGDYVMLVQSGQGDMTDLANTLIQQGHSRVVLLSDEAGEASIRHRDGKTGVVQIPRVFTVYDIRWVEEVLDQ